MLGKNKAKTFPGRTSWEMTGAEVDVGLIQSCYRANDAFR